MKIWTYDPANMPEARASNHWLARQLAAAQGGICAHCGSDLENERMGMRSVQIDHVVPRSRGGTDELSNLVAACRWCNEMKADYASVQEGMDHWLAGNHRLIDLGSVTTFERPADGDVRKVWYPLGSV